MGIAAARASFRYDTSPPVLRKTAPAQRHAHTGEAPPARPAKTLKRLFEEEDREQNGTKASATSPPGKPLRSGAKLSGRERLRRTHSDLDLGPGLCSLERAATSSENIGELLLFGNVVSVHVKKEVFHEGFRTKEGFASFLNAHLKNGSVEEQLRHPAQNWSAKTFQALFVPAWVGRPMEKGSIMIDLSGLSKAELDQLRKALVKSGTVTQNILELTGKSL